MSDCQGKGLVAFHMGTDRHWIISSNGFGHQKGRDSEFDTIFESLQQLNNRLPEHLSLGNAGLHMRGWISVEEVKQLRRNLTGRNWTPAFDEPLDGGCRDVVKHLSAHLRAAEKRTAGLLLRSHN